MEFARSTQASSWMFDWDSLRQCKEDASFIQSLGKHSHENSKPLVRKFACGFQQRSENGKSAKTYPQSTCTVATLPNKMAANDQDVLVHFHSHQIQRLVGPNAILPALRRSSTVLSTAIMLFRRFYLSNSVIDFHPRNIAAASALLAVKVDCEQRLEIATLAHATSIVNLKARKAALCRDELRAVSIEEIEEAERALLSGLDFRLRCHHPYGAIHVLAGELAASAATYGACDFHSPRGIDDFYYQDQLSTLCERALAVAQSALVYSDVNFLFPPGKIAFAAVAIALEGHAHGGRLGIKMRSYLRNRFPQKTAEELAQFERDVVDIVYQIVSCPGIDVAKFYAPRYHRYGSTAQHQASEIRRVFAVAAQYRVLCNQSNDSVSTPAYYPLGGRKRCRLEDDYAPSGCSSAKAARVTPTQTPFF